MCRAEGWERFEQVARGEVTVLRLLDRNLRARASARELADDLICSGRGRPYDRIVEFSCGNSTVFRSLAVGRRMAAAPALALRLDNGRGAGLRFAAGVAAAAFSILGS